MGLFWSLEPSPSGPHNIRMVQRDVSIPVLYQLSVFTGHLSLQDIHPPVHSLPTAVLSPQLAQLGAKWSQGEEKQSYDYHSNRSPYSASNSKNLTSKSKSLDNLANLKFQLNLHHCGS